MTMVNSGTRFFLLILLQLIIFCACSSSDHEEHSIKMMSSIELTALAAIKDSLTDIPGRRTSFFSTWDLSSPNPCSTFSGLICSSNYTVTSLALGDPLSNSPSLAGSLSPSISNLTQLTQLILYPGLVTGPIPPQLGALKNLRVLSLTNNRLTGPIPSSISSLPNLHTLDLSYNHLTGLIPPEIFTGLTNLRVLVMSSNSLSGELPATITTPSLLHLDLKNNMLTGTLPLKMPSSLRYLSVSKNEMWGQLNGLESLSDLVYLDLSMNQFNATMVPPSLFRPSLSLLFLQRNNLSGGLPQIISILPYSPGSVVDLSHNFLAGEISPVLAGVETLFLNNNQLSGKVPEEYVQSLSVGATTTLYLQHNYITEFPLESGVVLPSTVSLCLSYNCLSKLSPVGLRACPASAGLKISRPDPQCAVFNKN